MNWKTVLTTGEILVASDLAPAAVRASVLHECRHVWQRKYHGPEVPPLGSELLDFFETDAETWATSERYRTAFPMHPPWKAAAGAGGAK
jgi:hypothetical protein